MYKEKYVLAKYLHVKYMDYTCNLSYIRCTHILVNLRLTYVSFLLNVCCAKGKKLLKLIKYFAVNLINIELNCERHFYIFK